MFRKIKIFLKSNYYFLSSLLIFLSFPSYDIWFLKGYSFFAWISLVPLFLYIKGKGLKDIYRISFITGLIANFFTYRWIGNFAGSISGGYTIIVAFLIPVISVFFAGRVFLAEYLSKRAERFRFLIYPGVWIIIDWIISIGFLAFPWMYWGYSQYQFTSFIQLASVTGIFGVSFFIITVNYLISDLIHMVANVTVRGSKLLKKSESVRLITILFIFVIVTVYGKIILSIHDRPIKKNIRVSIAQSSISPWENWIKNRFTYLNELVRYTEMSLKDNPDLIIWSESATLELISFRYAKGKPSKFDVELYNHVRRWGKHLLTGEIGIDEKVTGRLKIRNPQNNAVLINGSGEVVKTYPKIHLVPFGEWFPYEKWFPSVKKLASNLGGSNFVPGSGPILFDFMGKKFAALICYEGIFYRLCREYRNNGADFFINITNDGWTDTFNGHMQHFSASVFRAIENGIWYVRAGNTGFSALIDPYGRIVNSIPILKRGYLTGDIDFSFNHDTTYMKYGDILLYLIMAFTGSIMLYSIYKKMITVLKK